MTFPMPCEDVLIRSLVGAIKRCQQQGAYGILVSGIEHIPIRCVVSELRSAGAVFVSLISGDPEQIDGDIHWARENGWSELEFGSGATHAVWVRNEAPPGALKVAFVWREEERLHSLTRRGYVSVGPQEVVQQVCRIAQDAVSTIPEKNLWKALSSQKLAIYATLDGVLRYYEEVVLKAGGEAAQTGDGHDAPRNLLPVMGLLRDPQLLTGRFAQVETIVRRLLDNGRMVERIQRADPQDRAKAGAVVRVDSELRDSYHQFLRVSNNDLCAQGELTFPNAERLLGGKSAVRDGTGGSRTTGDSDSRRVYPNFEKAAVELTASGESSLLSTLVELAASQLSEIDKTSGRLEEGDVTVKFVPNRQALALARAFSGVERVGGVLRVSDRSFDKVVEALGEYLEEAEVFDGIKLRLLQERLPQARKWAPSFEGAELLKQYLDARETLVENVDLLATAPLALFIGRDGVMESAQRLIDMYQHLLSHLEEHFGSLRRTSPEGAALVYNEILSLDTIRCDTPEETVVLLSPLHPLVLWKYVELATLVLNRGEGMTDNDKELFSDHITDLPEPLLALFVPNRRSTEGLQLGYSERIGSLPVYRPAGVVAADPKDSSVRLAATKLAALYPSVKGDLRIMILNPVSTDEVASAIRTLILDRGFQHGSIVVARYSRRNTPVTKFSNALDELAMESRVSVEELVVSSLEELATYLCTHPVHVLVVTGERTKNVEIIASEGTRLHPLSLPHKITADPWLNKIRLEPRSVQPGEGGRQHPFGVYQRLAAQMAGKHNTEFSQHESVSISLEECKPLLPYCQFVLLTGDPTVPPSTEMLRLTQGMDVLGDTVVTTYSSRIVQGIEELLQRMYYHPSTSGVKKLLDRLQEIGGQGIFATISESGFQGFSESALRGQLGLAVALDWYHHSVVGNRVSVISLDGYLARSWLRNRDDEKRNDLLAIRKAADGTIHVDLTEVKAYQATTDEGVSESHPGQQLRAVAKVIYDILHHQGDLLIDRRRELLRLQMFREGFKHDELDPEWVDIINDVLDGNRQAVISLRLIEVVFDDNLHVDQRVFESEGPGESPVDQLPVTRIRLGEAFIQENMGDVARRVQPSSEPAAQTQADSGVTAPIQDVLRSGHLSVQERGSGNQGDDDPSNGVEPSEGTTPTLGFEPSADELQTINRTARTIYRVLRDIGIRLAGEVDPNIADVGPTIVRYKVRLQTGERIASLQGRARDLMRELATTSEPIIDNLPNTNFVYIDLPRPQPRPAYLRPVLLGLKRDSTVGLVCPIGITPDGQVESMDLTVLPHMLVAGSTGSGKTMFLYSLLVGLTHLYGPQDMELVLIDPKQTDFVFFNRLRHLRGGRVITDAQEAITVLMGLLTDELARRTALLTAAMSRDIRSYNARHPDSSLAPILVVIDEFADLADVMDRQEREQFDLALRRLAQRARNVGIHLVLATQRPTTDIVNGTLKSNLPCRISFRLASQVDSRTILDRGGAEHLLGNGDMVVSFNGRFIRLQGFYLSEDDMGELLGY